VAHLVSTQFFAVPTIRFHILSETKATRQRGLLYEQSDGEARLGGLGANEFDVEVK
jgi:hypothetical protein